MRILFALGAIALLGGCQMNGPVTPPQNPAPPMVTPPSSGTLPPSTHPRDLPPPGATPPISPPRSGEDLCGARRLQHLVGRPLPQPFTAPGPVRIYASGQPVTMDYSAHRLNVEIDRSGRRIVVAVTCG
ncbi:I78 family peptidase inhibitor [Pararhodobacter sp.]|uniref:I78 family peptidase inhibitor n=1 Tax=Pararhodobacter sp. TaxID=2127056 RepID=UPI002AFDE05C|nr:I78 family peptidase inhibitor [Pararhodobacter sp.]